MYWKYLILCMLVAFEGTWSSPVLKEVESWIEEIEPEEKVREKRKIDLLEHLQSGGLGVKKSVAEEGATEESDSKPEGGLEAAEPSVPPAESESSDEGGTRTKKQIPNNVCIKISGCGRTACGPIVSARGPSVKMLLRGDSGMMYDEQMTDQQARMDTGRSAIQGRTFDSLLSLNPLASTLSLAVPTTTYAAPATTFAAPAFAAPATTFTAPATTFTAPTFAAPATTYSTETASTLAHTILRPAVAPVHVEPVSFNVLSHPVSVPSFHSMVTHHPLLNMHRVGLDAPKVQEIVVTPTVVKQPTFEVKPIIAERPEIQQLPQFVYPSRYGASYDGPMICRPYDEKVVPHTVQYRPDVHVISASKNLNISGEDFKSQMSEDDDKKVRDHLRQVNEIREEITQLNKAAQKIVDQQERLAEMQQRHLWKNEGGSPVMERSFSPYYANRIYTMPLAVSRANALTYPTTPEDIEFFVNMLQAGKKFGALSQTLSPALVSGLDTAKLILTANQASGEGHAADDSKQGVNGAHKNGVSQKLKM